MLQALPCEAACATLMVPVRRLLLAACVIAAALVAPGPAAAGVARLTIHDVPAFGARSLAAVRTSAPFQLFGVHWRGSGSVEARVRLGDGRWTPWQRVLEDADGPAPPGWRIGEPIWVGSGTDVQARRRGRVQRVRVLTVRSPVVLVPTRAMSTAGAPPIVSRAAWLADESLRRDEPTLSDELRMAHVHHTAGTNTYSRIEAPAVVRAIQVFHVKGNGWDDIGYNALVDRFGTVYEGRYGGLDRGVVGAHARGFNTGSFGVAVMGEYTRVDPPKPAVDALVRTLAWRLDVAHVDALGTFTGLSAGNERFGPGIPVFLRVISGHRDTGLTSCPGDRLYAQIPQIARRVAMAGLPKLYAPRVARDETGAVRFTATLAGANAWTVTVTDPTGVELARGSGSGTTVDWAWTPPDGVPSGTRWRIAAQGATAAEGTLEATAVGAVALSRATASSSVVSPNADGRDDTATITFDLSVAANVGAVALDESGVQVAVVEPVAWRRAGARTVVFDPGTLPDGRYVVRIDARATGARSATVDVPVAVTRTLGAAALTGPVVVPGRRAVVVRFTLAAAAPVDVKVLRDGRWIATVFSGRLGAGPRAVRWDGGKRLGTVRDGAYTLVVEATDAVATSRAELPVRVDGTAPTLALAAVEPPTLWVSEPATVTLVVNNARRRIVVPSRGRFTIPGVHRVTTLTATARDDAGNASAPLRRLRRPE